MMNVKKRKLIFGGLLLLVLLIIPLVTYLSQKPQESRSRAASSTTLSITPNSTSATPIKKNAGETVSLDVFIDPGNSNLPSVVKLDLVYDAATFQPAAIPFTVNKEAFPSILEGPVVSNGRVLLSVSIGSDATKAIQTPTKVGTLTLIAVNATSAPTIVGFGEKTQVSSIATSDESSENVLSTTVPAYLSVINTLSPTITLSPTDPAASRTPSPTDLPITNPTTTPTTGTSTLPQTVTTLDFRVLIHGIGNSGDNVNPTASSLSNKNPLHRQRTMEVLVFDNLNKLAASTISIITYSSASGSFIGTVDITSTITKGIYTIKIKEPTHLRRLLPGIHTLTPQTTTVMPDVALTAGDINNDNLINIVDYNQLIGCYSDLLPAIACTGTTKVSADINDDGFVNQHDYNFFLREVSVQLGG